MTFIQQTKGPKIQIIKTDKTIKIETFLNPSTQFLIVVFKGWLKWLLRRRTLMQIKFEYDLRDVEETNETFR